MHFNLFDPSPLQIFPTIPQPIIAAAAVSFALWVLVRWGAPLLLFYALTRVCRRVGRSRDCGGVCSD